MLDHHLAEHEWLADDYSIADMANWAWIRSHRWARVPTDGLEHLERWMASMAVRPGCRRGVEVPPPTRSADETKRGGRAITTL